MQWPGAEETAVNLGAGHWNIDDIPEPLEMHTDRWMHYARDEKLHQPLTTFLLQIPLCSVHHRLQQCPQPSVRVPSLWIEKGLG